MSSPTAVELERLLPIARAAGCDTTNLEIKLAAAMKAELDLAETSGRLSQMVHHLMAGNPEMNAEHAKIVARADVLQGMFGGPKFGFSGKSLGKALSLQSRPTGIEPHFTGGYVRRKRISIEDVETRIRTEAERFTPEDARAYHEACRLRCEADQALVDRKFESNLADFRVQYRLAPDQELKRLAGFAANVPAEDYGNQKWTFARFTYERQKAVVELMHEAGKVYYGNPCAEILLKEPPGKRVTREIIANAKTTQMPSIRDALGFPYFPGCEGMSRAEFDSVLARWGVDRGQVIIQARDSAVVPRYCGVPINVLEEERTRRVAAEKERIAIEMRAGVGTPSEIESAGRVKEWVRKQAEGRAVRPAPTITCPECAGSGEYVGLVTREVCRECNGKKVIPDPNAKPDKVHNAPKDVMTEFGETIITRARAEGSTEALRRLNRTLPVVSQDQAKDFLADFESKADEKQMQIKGSVREKAFKFGRDQVHFAEQDGEVTRMELRYGSGKIIVYAVQQDGKLYLDFENQ